ncbi:diguanylate cyclase [Pseudoclavibacter endophyticus]|uniref:ABC transporter permease n=1 Tax=Pseudoclavibacter endophyticus TaxID=1778590 RepID=A0A6H9WQ79_9MICO|nr:ABC transporter permease [Pseudoclavibacter endophyticus]KAB1649137.1 ABC transporter permease [Pseudoclavibacter endophyticus]GGA65114.1 diguanylate cyclase [Pseudoclavibacter endophyticus]
MTVATTTTLILEPKRRRGNPTLTRYLAAFRSPRGIIAVALILILGGVAFLAPVLFPGGYDEQTRDSLLPPSGQHLFGTDELGRDIFVRSVYSLRTDFTLIFVAVPISLIVGTALGLLGALSRIAGTIVQRILDIILGFPGLVLGICIVLVVGPGWTALVIAIAIAGLPAFGRLARAGMIEQSEREYVTAARTLGVRRGTILLRHILPNAIDPILVQGAVFVVGAIFIEAALSIVGLGIQPPEPSLGALLNVGIRYINQAPNYVLGPTVLLLLLALAFSLLADALNETATRK